MFKRWVVVILWGIALVGSSITGVLTPAEAVPLQALPPDIQQLLNTVWARLPAAARQQGMVAIGALSPGQAQQAVATLRSVRPNDLMQLAGIFEGIRASLPPTAQQRFVNGVWGVSPAEERFAYTLIQQQLQHQQQQSDQILGTVNRMTQRHRQLIEDMQGTTRRTGRQWWYSLGGEAPYHDRQGNEHSLPIGRVPGLDKRVWHCPSLSYRPLVAATPPASDCQLLAPGLPGVR